MTRKPCFSVMTTPRMAFLSIILWGFGWLAMGQGTASLTVDRNPVTAGQAFRITFEFQDAQTDFSPNRPPDIPGIRYLNGPSTSTSTQILNGSMTSTRGYTYSAVAANPGLIQIPSFRFTTSSGPITTQAIALRVVKASTSQASQPAKFEAIIEVDHNEVFLGQPVRVQYRIYNRLDGVDVRNYTFPDLSGAWRETVEGEDPRWETTVVQGQRFQVATLRTDLLYPTQTGELLLSGFDVQAQTRVSFFNTRPLSATAKPVKIQVLPIPGTPPAPSLGTFRNLKVKWQLDGETDLKANEALNVQLEFSGNGNLKLIGAPDVEWPADLEVFDPDIQDRIRTAVDGQSGKRTFTYLVIPRSEGQYEIELPALAYFDWAKSRFISLSSPPVKFSVQGDAQGDSPTYGFNSKSDVTILTRDLRFIRTETDLRPRASQFYGGFLHLLFWALPPLMFGMALWLRHRRNEQNAKPEMARNKEATRRMKTALKSAKAGGLDLEALGQSVHAYLQAKLALSQSEANRDRYAEAISEWGDVDLSQRWTVIVDHVDRGRYAPGAPEAHDLADQIQAAVDDLESAVSNKKETAASRSRTAMSVLIPLLLMSLPALAVPEATEAVKEFQEGNVAYTEGRYDDAIASYERVAEQWTAFELEYNLAGAHYKSGNIGESILHFERARKLRPSDDDLQANLLLAEAAVTDRIEELPDLGLSALWKDLLSKERLNAWLAASLLLWLAGFLLLSIRSLSMEVAIRRPLGLIAPVAILFALGFGLLGQWTHEQQVAQDGAVVMSPRIEVMSSPGQATDAAKLFVLHEGTVVQLLRAEGDWLQIQLKNGNTGWVRSETLEAI